MKAGIGICSMLMSATCPVSTGSVLDAGISPDCPCGGAGPTSIVGSLRRSTELEIMADLGSAASSFGVFFGKAFDGSAPSLSNPQPDSPVRITARAVPVRAALRNFRNTSVALTSGETF